MTYNIPKSESHFSSVVPTYKESRNVTQFNRTCFYFLRNFYQMCLITYLEDILKDTELAIKTPKLWWTTINAVFDCFECIDRTDISAYFNISRTRLLIQLHWIVFIFVL